MFFKEFSKATKAFFAYMHPTTQLFLKVVMVIWVVLPDETWSSNELINELDNPMHAKFAKY